jgi:hypothetical protein
VVFIQVVYNILIDKFEILIVIIIFAFPLWFSWIPFVQESYGPFEGYICWIQSRQLDDECTIDLFGVITKIVLYQLPAFVLFTIMFVLMIISLAVTRRRRRKSRRNSIIRIEKQLEGELKVLFMIPVMILITNCFSAMAIATSIIIPEHTATFVINILTQLVSRCQGILITLIFTLEKDTRKLLNKNEIKKAMYEWRAKLRKAKITGKNNTDFITSFELVKETRTDSYV